MRKGRGGFPDLVCPDVDDSSVMFCMQRGDFLTLDSILTELSSKKEFVAKVKDVVRNLPRPVFVVLRYIFAFLNQ